MYHLYAFFSCFFFFLPFRISCLHLSFLVLFYLYLFVEQIRLSDSARYIAWLYVVLVSLHFIIGFYFQEALLDGNKISSR